MGAYEYQGEPQDQLIISVYEIEMDTVIEGGFAVDSLSILNYGHAEMTVTGIQTGLPFSLSLDKTNWTSQLNEVIIPAGDPFTPLMVYIKFEGLAPGFHSDIIAITIGGIANDVQVSGFCKSTGGINENGEISNLSIIPNPFSTETRIMFYLEKRGDVKMLLYNSSGIKVEESTLIDQPAGTNIYRYNSHALPRGIYFLSMKSGEQTFHSKLIILSR